MSLKILAAKPPRVTITRIDNPEARIELPFNPTILEKRFSVNYSTQVIPGLSFSPMQYINTNNIILPIQLFLTEIKVAKPSDTESSGNKNDQRSIKFVEGFLQSFCYSIRRPGFIKPLAPPLMGFVWPRVISIFGNVTDMVFRHQRFNIENGESILYTASFNLHGQFGRNIRSDEFIFGENKFPRPKGR